MAISDVSICVYNWRTAAKTSLQGVLSDSVSVEVCNCGQLLSTLLTRLRIHLQPMALRLQAIINRKSFHPMVGCQTVIRTAQLLILQEFPRIARSSCS